MSKFVIKKDQHGIALLMVIFTVALLSILGLSLTRSTSIGAQLHKAFADRFKSELLLKSVQNVALEIIAQDSRETDPPKDSWGPFIDGQIVPADLLGIFDSNVQIGLEITAEASKIPLRRILSNIREKEWRDILAELFIQLVFDDDDIKDSTGLFKNRSFNSKEMVANLVDFLDKDNTSFFDGDYNGIEGELPENFFPSEGKTDFKLEDLSIVPGFSPERMKKLSPFVTPISEFFSININLASPIVLKAIDPTISDESAQAVYDFAHSDEGPFGPFNQEGENILATHYPNFNKFRGQSTINFESNILQVISKVQIGTRKFFMKSLVRRQNKGNSEPPDVIESQFYG